MQCTGRIGAGRTLAHYQGMRSIFLAIICMSLCATPSLADQARNKSTSSSDQVLAAQVALDRAGFSSGEIDGRQGSNTARALRAFQEAQGLTPSGQLDTATIARLGDPFTNPTSTYAISADDVAGPFVEAIPADMMKKASLPALGYTSVRELLAERFHMSPALLDRLNPNATYKQGDVLTVPNVEPYLSPSAAKSTATAPSRGNAKPADAAKPDAAKADVAKADAAKAAAAKAGAVRNDMVVTVTEKTKTLTVADATGNVVFQAPVTVGSTHDPLPVGEWKVTGVQRNPTFNYNPDLFWDADPTHSKAKLAAGPNNPVGAVWIDLSKEHYGIHGTPEPSRIGHTESHGCIRLTNWDVTRLAALVGPGTKVVLR
jgi:lipoprotein-anchoring transpeptidase ErfK/SrfK